MSLSVNDKIRFVTKKILDLKSITKASYEAFEEYYPTYQSVYTHQIWRDSYKIPETNPLQSNEHLDASVTTGESGDFILEKAYKRILTNVRGNSKAFYNETIKYIIPETFGDGSYAVKLYNGSTEILKGDYAWNIDYDSGIVYFEDELPIISTLYLTCYFYIGAIGNFSGLDRGIQGAQGLQGPSGFQGSTNNDALKWKGQWISGTYDKDDLVYSGVQSYISLQNNNNNILSNGSAWFKITSANSATIDATNIKYVSPNFNSLGTTRFNKIQNAILSCGSASETNQFLIIVYSGNYIEDLIIPPNIHLYFHHDTNLYPDFSTPNSMITINAEYNATIKGYLNVLGNQTFSLKNAISIVNNNCDFYLELNKLECNRPSIDVSLLQPSDINSKINLVIRKCNGSMYFRDCDLRFYNTNFYEADSNSIRNKMIFINCNVILDKIYLYRDAVYTFPSVSFYESNNRNYKIEIKNSIIDTITIENPLVNNTSIKLLKSHFRFFGYNINTALPNPGQYIIENFSITIDQFQLGSIYDSTLIQWSGEIPLRGISTFWLMPSLKFIE